MQNSYPPQFEKHIHPQWNRCLPLSSKGNSFSPPCYNTISSHIWETSHIWERHSYTDKRKTSLKSKPQYQDLKKAFPLEWLRRKYGNAKTRETDEAKGNASIKLAIVESITAKSTTLRWSKEYSCKANACQSIPKFWYTRKSIFMHIYTSKNKRGSLTLIYYYQNWTLAQPFWRIIFLSMKLLNTYYSLVQQSF